MANERIGTDALRLSIAGARAQAGAAPRGTPALPPDRVASPFNDEYRPPWSPENRPPKPPRAGKPRAEPKQPKEEVAAPPRSKAKHDPNADRLVNELLLEWSRNTKRRGLIRANLQLGNQLMRNGALLIQHGYPIDTLGSLIRICEDLTSERGEGSTSDSRIDEIRKKLAFNDTEAPEEGEEEQPTNARASIYQDDDEDIPE